MMVISIYLKVYIEFLFAMPDYECYTRVHPPKWMATVAAHFGLKHNSKPLDFGVPSPCGEFSISLELFGRVTS